MGAFGLTSFKFGKPISANYHGFGVMSMNSIPLYTSLIQRNKGADGTTEVVDTLNEAFVSRAAYTGNNCIETPGTAVFVVNLKTLPSPTLDITITLDLSLMDTFDSWGYVTTTERCVISKRAGDDIRVFVGTTLQYVTFTGTGSFNTIRITGSGDVWANGTFLGNTGGTIADTGASFLYIGATINASAITAYKAMSVTSFIDHEAGKEYQFSEGEELTSYDIYDSGVNAILSSDTLWATNDNAERHNLEKGCSEYIEAPLDTTSIAIAEYYDDRLGVFHTSMDDYGDNAADDMIYAMELCREAGVPVEVAVITSYCSQDSWDRLQEQIDLGGVTVASHSKYHRNPDTYPDGDETTLWTWDELDLDVQESFAEIEANLTLPERHRFNGDNYCTSWTQPWGTAVGNVVEYHAAVRALFLDLGVLDDRTTNKANTNPENLLYAVWDSTNSTFGRIGGSDKWNTWDFVAQTSYHKANILNGGVSSYYTHPQKQPWLTYLTDEADDPSYTNEDNYGYYQYRVTLDMAGRTDTWYATLTDIYQYRYLATQSTTTVRLIDNDTAVLLNMSIDIAEREKYGLSIPVTYKWTNTSAMDSANLVVDYIGEDDKTYRRLTDKTDTTELYNNIECWRRDGDDFYISACMPQTGSSFSLRLTEVS